MEIERCELFRVTRNANTERDEEHADDLLAMIETELRERKFAPIVRLEVGTDMDPLHRGMLAAELGLDEAADVFEVDGMLGHARPDGDRRLEPARPARPPAPSGRPPRAAVDERNIFHIIRDRGSILLHHPYESFSTSVERFLREASRDPKVRAIKMTLYRTSDGLPGHRLPDRRRAQRQAGRRGGGAQGPLRRGGQHPLGEPAGGGRHPRHLRRRRAEDPLQGRSWSCATTTTGCAATRTSAPATTTPARRGCTPTWACSPATRPSATT